MGAAAASAHATSAAAAARPAFAQDLYRTHYYYMTALLLSRRWRRLHALISRMRKVTYGHMPHLYAIYAGLMLSLLSRHFQLLHSAIASFLHMLTRARAGRRARPTLLRRHTPYAGCRRHAILLICEYHRLTSRCTTMMLLDIRAPASRHALLHYERRCATMIFAAQHVTSGRPSCFGARTPTTIEDYRH